MLNLRLQKLKVHLYSPQHKSQRQHNPTNFLDMALIFIYQNEQEDKHVKSHMFNHHSSLSHIPFYFFPHLISFLLLASLSLVWQIANSSLKGCVKSACKFPFSAKLNEIQLLFLLIKSVLNPQMLNKTKLRCNFRLSKKHGSKKPLNTKIKSQNICPKHNIDSFSQELGNGNYLEKCLTFTVSESKWQWVWLEQFSRVVTVMVNQE